MLIIIKEYNMVVYYLIKHVRSSTLLLCKCFSCLNKYKIVGKGWVKSSKRVTLPLFVNKFY